MGSPATIDVERILTPISEENPSGPELSRTSPSLDKVVTLRDEAKTSEKKLREQELYGKEEGEPSIPEPRWHEMVEAAIELLANESKDLRVAAWLTEGLLREHGFAGLRDGLRVCRGLCSEQFWPTIHPRPDEFDGHEMTVAQLGGVTGEASAGPINEIVVTFFGDERYTLADYADAEQLETLDPASREKRVTDGAISFDKFEHAVRNTEGQFYRDMMDDLEESITLLREISDFLDANCQDDQYGGQTSPSVVPLRNRLVEIQDTFSRLARAHLEVPAEEAQVEGETGELIQSGTSVVATQAPPQQANMANAVVTSREDAFKALTKIADYFERTEPHSPLSHAIRQTVTWGGMTYQELLKDLIKNKDALEAIFQRVGVPDTDN